jgi:hypothetical protein
MARGAVFDRPRVSSHAAIFASMIALTSDSRRPQDVIGLAFISVP